MSTNPLLAQVKLPGRVFPLPSKGKFYQPGVLAEHVKDGEVQVKPMSALAEMKLRNADLLYSGKIIRELCQECVPEILKPEALVTKDVDALFAYLRLVTYGTQMSISSMHTCKTAKVHSYEINLESVVSNPNNNILDHADMLFRIELTNGQIVHAKPPTYQEAMDVVFLKHELAKLEADNKQPSDDQLKKIFLADILAVIESVEVQGAEGPIVVTDRKLITEWFEAISKPILNEIYAGMAKTDKWGFNFKVPLKCKDCGEVYEHDLELDPISFFYG
jgi:hypothetical protein